MSGVSRLLKLVPTVSGARHTVERVAPTAASELAFDAVDDVFVNTAVKSALLREPAVARAGIHVSTSRGVVQLSGFVSSRDAIGRAVTIARSVSGVRAVRNDMLRA